MVDFNDPSIAADVVVEAMTRSGNPITKDEIVWIMIEHDARMKEDPVYQIMYEEIVRRWETRGGLRSTGLSAQIYKITQIVLCEDAVAKVRTAAEEKYGRQATD